jgi:hypothetical protein
VTKIGCREHTIDKKKYALIDVTLDATAKTIKNIGDLSYFICHVNKWLLTSCMFHKKRGIIASY